jgi:ADP-ribose pyrophosphatase YjhB (NUDIX family)
MRRAVRAIVIKDDALLVMHRNKFGDQYYTLVGGGIDHGESAEQSLYREVAEETGVTIANPRLVFVEEAGDIFGPQYIYLCEYQAGNPALASDSEEAKIHAMGQNLYTPMWLPLKDLTASRFLSEPLKQHILQAVQQKAWPENPITFQHVEL